MTSELVHAFTVDVEDWFHTLDCPQMPPLEKYDDFESRVEVNTTLVLDMLERHEVRGTFFILGWVADRYPGLVRQIVDAGHEIAVHGYAHVLASGLSDKELETDTRRAVEAVGTAAGVAPVGYRSPGGSLLDRQRWLFDLLLELGIRYDSSVYPRSGSLAETEGHPVRPYVIHRNGDAEFWEYPSTTRRVLGVKWPFAEGGYLRLMPLPLVRKWFHDSAAEQLRVNVCVHPREFDPEQPRLPLSPLRQWKTQVNIRGNQDKVESILSEFRFAPMGHILDELNVGSVANVSSRM
ncbi:polysaccharide deacetylase family protein [Ectothiorhodospira lacustris]|uniref:polysaccharide deacetylase family protein n=1 Tax=Ectothiorhodospira lacustris TaxID=2899127 RepID=UPI001EE92415|nr:polysaccharide deacetylase family protein [Ectothiorhodospira lacustris]MCG5502202.1 polysaccharide deacetylase family protein [Ectothiorhodospira lacustris]